MPDLPEPLSDPGCVLVDNPVTNQREIVVTGYYDDLDDHDHGDQGVLRPQRGNQGKISEALRSRGGAWQDRSQVESV